MTNTKKILGIVLALIVLTLAMSISIFATETVAEEKGYMLVIYNEDGTEAMTVNGTNSISEFNIAKALDDAYTFGDNAFLFGISGTPTYELILLQDVETAEMVAIPAGKNVVVNLNGYDITSGYQEGSTTKHLYPFDVYGNLTITDETGNGSITGRGIYVRDGSTVTVEGGSIYGIDSNGGSALFQYGGDIVINGGRVEQKAEGTYNFAINANGGTVTVNGGWVGGNHGAIAAGGAAVEINNGTLVCTGTAKMTDNVLYTYDNGSIVINGGTFIADNDSYSGGCCVYDANGKTTVNAGNFSNSSGGDVWGTTGTTINGGTFENLIETSHVTVGSTIVNGGKTYTMTENGMVEGTVAKNVASVNGVGYETLAEAIAYANTLESATVVVLSDTTLGGTVISGNVTIDLNGCVVTSTADHFFYMAPGSLTVKDTSANKTGTLNGVTTGNAFIMYGNSSLTIEGGTIYTMRNGIFTYYSNNTVVINGGKLETLPNANDVTAAFYLCATNSTVTVNGGTILGNINTWGDTIIVNGGSFSVNVGGYCANGYTTKLVDGLYVVVETEKSVFIGETGYYSLEDALNAAKASDTIVIKVAGTYALKYKSYDEGRYWLPADLTIKGTVDGVVIGNAPAFSASNITIENVDFINTTGSAVVFHTSGTSTFKNCDLIAPNGTYYSTASGKLIFENCAIKGSASYGISVNEGSGSVSLTNCVLAGWNSFGVSGKVTFTNCEFTNEGAYDYVVLYENAEFTNTVFGTEVMVGAGTAGQTFEFTGCSVVDGSSLLNVFDEGFVEEAADVIVDGLSLKVVYVAQIGDVKYATFEDAVKAIPTDGTDVVIKILTDIELTNSIEFNYGTGKITFTADAPVVIKQTKVGLDLAFTIGNAATIVVDENVTFEIYDNASGMYLYYGPSLVINGSISGGQNWGCLYLFNGTHLVSTTGSINVGRLQIAYTELTVLGEIDTNYLLVEGADFIANGAIIEVGAIHDSNNGGTRWGASDFSFLNGTVVNANTITLKYADSVINLDLSSSITANKIEGIGKIVIDVSGFNGTATQVIKADMSNFTGTVELVNGDGKQSYEITDSGLSIISAVAQIGDKTFATLQAAINAANGGTVVVLENIDIADTTIKIPAGTTVTLDLNGKIISGVCNANQASMFVIENTATLTVKDTATNGKITYAAGQSNVGFEMDVKGSFILESGTIELTGSWSLGFAVDVRPNAWGTAYTAPTSFTMNGGKIASSDTAVRVASNSSSSYAPNNVTFTMNGGVIESGWDAIFVQHLYANNLYVNVKNGSVTGSNSALRIYGDVVSDVYFTVEGGTFVGELKNLEATGNGNTAITGGLFAKEPTSIPEGYAAIQNLDGNYVVGVAPTATVKDYGPTLIPGGEYGIWDGKNYTSKGTESLPLSFVMQFIADQTAADMANSPYADWYADFVITFDGLENDTFIANGCYLAGFYGDFGWVKIPVDGMTIEEGVRYPVMLGVGLGQKYDYVCSGVKDFKCALYITPEILEANPNLTVNLELAVVDNSKGQNAAAEAMVNGTSYNVTDYDYVAEDFIVELTLKGSGTEADPYQIGSLQDLILFRDSVNAGETKYNAKGVYVALTANIDMASVDWSVNIGDDCNATFDGIFDGKGYTIYNLNSTETAQKADGYVCTGLFGAIYGSAVIKNLTIENVSINTGDFTGNNVAAVVGFAYSCTGSIENVKVIGNININAAGIAQVGTIVGYDYYGKLTIKDCVVSGNNGSYIKGSAEVGGIVGYSSTNSLITNCTVENIAIEGKGLVGGIAGIALYSAVVKDSTVKNVALVTTGENWINGSAIAIGSISKSGTTVSNITYENVTANGTAINRMVGSAYAEKPTTVVPAVQAQIGDKYYVTYKEAFNAAVNGDTIVILVPGEFETTVADGLVAIKNLDGNYVVGVAPTATVKDYGPTIIAGGDYGIWDGKNYTSTSTADMPLSFVMQFIADQTAADMANSPYADWYADFVITFDGLENDAIIADGCYLAGFYGDFGWVKIPVDGMTIEEGVRYPVMLGVGLGQKYDYVCSGVKDFKCALYITPEILAANPNLTVNLELAVVDNSKGQNAAAEAMVNGTSYNVTDYDYDAEDFQITVATVGEKKFTTLQAAIDYAIANGGKVTLVSSININEGIVINGNVEIDLAGYTVALDSNVANCVFNIENGTVAIANGTIYTNNGQAIYAGLDKDTSYAPVVTLENVTLKGADFGLSVFGGANVTIGNGVVISGSVEALRVWNSAQVTVNAGASITCTGNGEVARAVAVYENASVSVTGGTFTGIVDKIAGTIAITGGTFTSDVSAYVAEGYAAIQNLDGIYVVGVAPTATVKDYGPTIIPGGEYGIWDGKNYTSKGTEDLPLSFVMQFIADQTAADMANSPYADWYADFVITFDGLENDAIIANGCYLAGFYGDFGWVKIPVDGMTIEEGVRYPVMLGVGLGQKYDYVCSGVKDFKCALYITPEILAANPNLTVNLELAAVDNSKGQNAAAEAMVNGTSYNVTDYDYVADDFIVDYVAAVGNKQFTSLADAIAYANANGGTVTLLDNIELDAPIVVTGTVVLDLAGYTINYNSTVQGEAMITNKGNLTINDSVGTGVIYYNYTGAADPSYSKGNYTISNAGTLTVNGGKITIANLSGHAKYPIDNNSTTGNAVLVINGGHLYNYNTSAIRMFCNSTTYKNSVTINGGLIEGYCAIWVQNPGKNTVNCDLTVNGGEIKSTAKAYVNGTAALEDVSSAIYFTISGNGGAWSEGSFVALNGGTFNENVYLAEQAPASITIGDEAIFNGYLELPMVPVASVNGNNFATLAEAIAYANANGGTVTLLDNIELDAPIVVTGTVVLDLAGYTINYNSTTMGEAMITNKGNLTINDSVGTGVIYYNYTGANDSSYGKGNYTISNSGTLTINGGEISIANLRAHAKYPIDNNSTTGDAILVINGGHLYNYNTSAIRMFCNSTTYQNSVTINGGLIEGYCAIWVQNPGKNTVNCDLTVTGGEIRTTAAAYVNGTSALEDVSSAIYFTISASGGAWSEGSFVALNGGTFNENVYLAEQAPASITIGDEAIFNGYLELPMVPVASVNGNNFATLAEAIAYANANGGTVKLLDNIALSETIAVTGTVTLDLNGYTITGTDNSTKSFSLFTNKGTFTITGNGAITLVATNNRGWEAYSSVISNTVGGKLIVEGGTIEHLGGTDMAYAIDNLTNGKGTYAETVVNGGLVKSTYRAIRQFLNGIEAQNILTVNGGTIEGANKAIFFQDPSANANTGSLTIGENAVVTGGVYLFVTAGSTEWPVEVSIATSALANGANDVTSKNVPEGYFVKEANGVIGVEKIDVPADIRWYDVSISLANSMKINYYLYSNSIYDGYNYYARVIKHHDTGCNDHAKCEVSYIPMSAWEIDETLTRISIDGIAAKDMACQVEIQIFVGEMPEGYTVKHDNSITTGASFGPADGSVAVSLTGRYSVLQYCKNAFTSNKEELIAIRPLVADLLLYGEAAQSYFGHYITADDGVTPIYVTNGIEDIVNSYATTPERNVQNVNKLLSGSGKYIYDFTLSLETTVYLNVYLQNLTAAGTGIADFDANNIKVHVTFNHYDGKVHDKVYSVADGTLLVNENGVATVVVDDLAPADLFDLVHYEIFYGDESLSEFVMSAESYCARVYTRPDLYKEKYDELVKLCDKIVALAEKAEEYFKNKSN